MVLSLVLIQVVTFAIIIGILHFLFGSQLKAALNRLQILHQESLEKEEILNKELERAKVQCQSEIARSKEEARLIIEAARRNAEKIAAEAVENAEARARKTTIDASEKAKKLETEVLATAEEKAVGLAQDLIRYTFSPKGQEILHVQLVDELIGELKGIAPSRLAVSADHAEVTTPVALTPSEEETLKKILSEKLNADITLVEKIDTSLIVGMTIALGGLVIDGSLKNKISRAMTMVRANRQ